MIHVVFGMVLGLLSSSCALLCVDLDMGLNLEAHTGIAEPFANTGSAEPIADTGIAVPFADTGIAELFADMQD